MDLTTLEQANTIYRGIVVREKMVSKSLPLIDESAEDVTSRLIDILQLLKDKGYDTELNEIVKPLISGSVDEEIKKIDQLYDELYAL